MNNDGYLGNALIKRDGVKHSYTEEELQEYLKCSQEPAYFIEKYIKVIHVDKGIVPFKLYDYQKDMIKHFNDNRFSIVLSCRQSGKTASTCAYLLWCALFKPDQNIALLANKAAMAKEMLARITLALENVPFFLQPGCKALNKMSIELSNNTRIFAAATSSSSIRGQSCSIVALDEFAFVNRANEFYTSTYPVITSGQNSKVIITSTPNGIGNMFYKLWEGAVQGSNEFSPFTVSWWDVPGRDQKWKEQTIANTSEAQFRQEFEVEFIGSSNTLISPTALLGLKAGKALKTLYDGSLRIYEEPIESHLYILSADTSQGRGLDYSAFTIIDVSSKPFKEVAVYHNNLISPLIFPTIINAIGTAYNNAIVLVESNGPGQIVATTLYYDFEYENMFVESAVKKGKIGITMTKKVKYIGTSALKDLIEEEKLQINDPNTIIELSYFEETGNSYKAKLGKNDDIVMCLVIFSWFISNDIFTNFSEENIKDLIYRTRLEEMEEELFDFGFLTVENAQYLNAEYEEMKNNLEEWKNL